MGSFYKDPGVRFLEVRRDAYWQTLWGKNEGNQGIERIQRFADQRVSDKAEHAARSDYVTSSHDKRSVNVPPTNKTVIIWQMTWTHKIIKPHFSWAQSSYPRVVLPLWIFRSAESIPPWMCWTVTNFRDWNWLTLNSTEICAHGVCFLLFALVEIKAVM